MAVNGSVGRAVYHLRCGPAHGDLPDNRAACATLSESPELVTSPKPFACFGGTASWWDVSVSGRIAGHRLDHKVSTCWTPQMAMIGRLGLGLAFESHLVPRRNVRVIPGVQRTIAAGTLRPGDLITCDIRGHRLAAGIPTRADVPTTVSYSGAHIVTVTLEVARDRDGTLLTSCHDGDPQPERLAFRG